MYKIFTWVDIAACILVILMLLFIFIYPHIFSKRYYESFSALQEHALQCTRSEKWAEAQSTASDMVKEFYAVRNTLRYFYDHSDINELESCILSANELILREDGEQSSSELVHALTLADFLRSIQDFDLANLF